jgi:putative flippase GtrA
MFSEIKRYLLVGVGSNLINFLIYQILYRLGIQLFLASLLGYLAGLLVSYTFSRLWVFGQKFVSSRKLVVSFLLVYAVGGLGMSLLIVAATNIFEFDYRISWMIGALFAVVNNFWGQKFFVFKEGSN